MSFRDVGACLFKDKKRDFIEPKPYSLRPSINTKFKKGEGILIFKKKGDAALSFHLTQFQPRLAETAPRKITSLYHGIVLLAYS